MNKMAYVPQLSANYVKFIRGTTNAWEHIKAKDENTLYFISDADATSGKLYLGEKLISDGTVNITTSLSELNDIVIGSGIANNSLLVYNSDDSKWENKPLGEVLSAIVDVMVGATSEKDGVAGLVPQPKAGDEGLYLKGNGTWDNPTAELSDLITTKFNVLYGSDTGSIQQIANAEVLKIVASAPEDYDTLAEIAEWIKTHDTILNVTEAETQLEKLNTAVFGTEEKTDENGNVTQEAAPGLVATVNNLSGQISSIKNDISSITRGYTTLNNKITALDEKLCWNDLVEETTT